METNKNKGNELSKDQGVHSDKPENTSAHKNEENDEADDFKYTSLDKYLAIEQPGVSFTTEKNHVSNSDYLEFDNDEAKSEKFKLHNKNSRNSDAFSQDDYILRDNLDLDEDQANSISADDAPDTNTTDEIL